MKAISLWKILGGLPIALIFAHTLVRLYAIERAGGYGTAPLTPGLIRDNAGWILGQLFQVDTSPLITAGFALLLALLLLFVVDKAAKKQFSSELVFTLFLLGQFASMYLILCTSWAQVLRYWYILIPVFATLLAFSAKFMLEFAESRQPFRLRLARFRPHPRTLAASALVGFIGFFVCCNYYNFLFQTVIQHSTRSTEAKLLAEITRLHDQGEYVYIPFENPHESLYRIVGDYHGFLARFYGREYEVHTEPPEETGRPYYIARHSPHRYNLPETYRPLAYARSVAGVLQAGEPYQLRDAGAPIWDWYVYDDKLDQFWRNGLDWHRFIEEAGAPIIQSFFDVYYTSDRLIYVKDQCAPEDVEPEFFLHVYPVDKSDLSKRRKQHGFDAIGIIFEDHGIRAAEKCIAEFEAPAYKISRITAGQWIPGEGQTWSSGFNWDGRE